MYCSEGKNSRKVSVLDMEAYSGIDVGMHKHLAWDADEISASSSIRFNPLERALETHWTEN